MATATGHRMESNSGMGPRKTMIIMVTVVGCVAILWPKVFYPMMVGNGQNKNVIKDHRGAGCCGVVLDQETFANASISYATSQQQQQQQEQNLFRKRNFAPYVDIDSIRQERPPHLRPEAMHPAMRERGRAIPQAGSIHGGERPQTPPRIVEGRPGPIPGMRPPMGAGSHQATKSANSMGFIMPLYTIGIVSFFIYTIMKLIFKKTPATPYAEVKPDPAFRNEVFTTEQYIKRPDDGTTKLDQPQVTAATNGELVVPVAVSSVSNAVVSAEPSSVQSELSIDYEQLSKQKEITKPNASNAPEQTPLDDEPANLETTVQDETVETSEIVSEQSAEEFFSEQQPTHDPTTEKVVDGIVVQKVVAVEESAELSPEATLENVVKDKPQEEHDLKEDSAATIAVKGVIDGLSDNGESEVVAQPIIEEIILEKQITTQNSAILPIIIPTDDVSEHLEKEQMENEVLVEPAVEEEILVQQKSSQNAAIASTTDQESIAVRSLDEPDAASFVTETIITDETTNLETEENVQNELVTEALAEELVEPIAESVSPKEINDNIQEQAPLLESSNISDEPIVQSPSEHEKQPQIPEESALTASAEPASEQVVCEISEVNNTPIEPVEQKEKQESYDVTYSKQENEQFDNVTEEVTGSVSTEAEGDKESQNIVSEKIPQNDAANAGNESKQTDDETVTKQLDAIDLDADTADLVHNTVEDITLTAEQLVQEVLEQAEELAKQQEQYSELPEYDPATQKLVDGVVVERFDQQNAQQTEAIAPTASQETSDETTHVTEEPTVDDMELAAVVEQTLTEEDAGEMDSISEDTSLSVASVIEQQPKAKESDDSKTISDVLHTTDDTTDSTSGDVTLVETKNLPVHEALLAATAVDQVPIEATEPGNKFGAAAVEGEQVDVVIEQQPSTKASEEPGTLSEALITTELSTSCASSEPVFVELNDQPTVEVETVLEEINMVVEAGNLSGAAAHEADDNKSVSIEEVQDVAATVDEVVEGKVIEEHIIRISIEKASLPDTMTITEVTGDDAIVELPNISKTASNLPSPSITAVPVMYTIDEKQEAAEVGHEKPHNLEKHSEIPLTTLEHVTKEALVERTLNEAAAVVNEIESIVDHIITEKLIHSGTSDAMVSANGLQESSPQEPPRLAASAALIVEAIESKSSGVHSMVSSRDSTQNMQTITVTNGLTTNLDKTIGDTNLPASSDSPPTESPSFAPAPTPSSEAFPVPEPTTMSPSEVAPTLASASETQSINFVADEQRLSQPNVAAGPGGPDAVEQRSTVVPVADPMGAATSTIGQVPTSVSNVTNPKFLTLNLANYSTSDSSGNNSKSSSLSIANLSQSGASLAGGDSADQLMELELLRKKLDETERAMTKIIANMGNIPKGQETNVNEDEPATEVKETEVSAAEEDHSKVSNGHAIKPADSATDHESSEKETSGGESSSANSTPEKKPKKRDTSTERGTVKVMAMEVTAQRENGKRLSRPSTPLLPMAGHSETANAPPTEEQETRSIVLDGRLPHDSKILVSDAETAVEKLEPENSEEEDDAPVILSGKMTLSLINMDFIEKDATGTVAVGEIVTELHKPQEEAPTTASSKDAE
ncbi:mucin-17-like [Anopheles maculipalpis]|uniref:mucin-17-like n=1 Tax=Anopheles maculipalpis TaxID=1496333 RepID=UPI002158FBE5|nr:mucin-17-like [Anopheles maculipalpis]